MATTTTRQKRTPAASAAVQAAPRAGKQTGLRAARPGPPLLVVESPAKGKTLQRLLGTAWEVQASAGHVKDLPEAREGVDIDNGFLPTYEVLKGKNRVLSDLKRAARKAPRVVLATDPDREGEAIAWHLAEELGRPGDPRLERALLEELTPEAVQQALSAPRPLDRRRAEAQQARRILDRLVGFRVSPILWKRVRRGLSAGRVQSVAVRLLVDREKEIEAFRAESTWTVRVELRAGKRAVEARVVGPDGEPERLPDAGRAEALRARLAAATFHVERVERRELRRAAPPPFTTATLQQESSRRLGFTPRRTMSLAQRLYEGVELGDEGAVGLLSYVRTDSVRLSPAAEAGLRQRIEEAWGADHLPRTPNTWRVRSEAAQEAHEAIRPVSLAWPPERVEELLAEKGARDLCRLYALVWSRTLASQMAPATWEEAQVEIAARGEGGGPIRLLATGRRRSFDGWLRAHGETPPAEVVGGDEPGPLPGEAPLPRLAAGDALLPAGVQVEERRSEPPPRFDEAALVRELEERGIGRPSTYASILDVVQEKGYVERLDRALRPTGLGRLVTEELVRSFPRELEPAFSARMEARLDEVEEGKVGWQEVLSEFWSGFAAELSRAERKPPPAEAADERIACPDCGKTMVVRFGRRGEFLSCSGYPACRHTMDFRREGDRIVPLADEPAPSGEACPTCGAPMVVKRGRFGRFLACTRYPRCKTSRPIPLGVACPTGCGGQVTERHSARGRTFYGCTRYPACDFVSWDRPVDEPCPRCGSSWLVEKRTPPGERVVACPHKECGFKRAATGPG